MWRVLVLTGARIGEMLALRKDDIVPAGMRIDENSLEGKPSRTKNGKTRYAPLPATLRADIETHAAVTDGDLLFPSPRGKMSMRTGENIREMITRARTGAKIPDLTPRMCRTIFATLYNSDPRDVQDILGHSKVDLTMAVYRKPICARQQAAVEELEARLSGKVVEMPKRESA